MGPRRGGPNRKSRKIAFQLGSMLIYFISRFTERRLESSRNCQLYGVVAEVAGYAESSQGQDLIMAAKTERNELIYQ
ncbi:hypothetical protein L2E82_18337 [Cichorium intybus]|uniref:Uncharacterized protein n=1 Tax=Cichorium intybus TaxID=13427 RepID=A0ACB9FAI3_CICIN|nr:hypothetical protein L2E82_18337 [Cichorium intybus]